MANETKIALYLSFDKSGVTFAKPHEVSLGKSTGNYISQLCEASTTAAAITPGAIGYLALINRGTTADATLGTLYVSNSNEEMQGGTTEAQKLGPQDFTVLRCSASTVVAIDASVVLNYEKIWIPD